MTRRARGLGGRVPASRAAPTATLRPITGAVANAGPCVTDSFSGLGAGSGISGADLDWTLQTYPGGDTDTIVAGQLVAIAGTDTAAGGTEAIITDALDGIGMRVSVTIAAELDVSSAAPPAIVNFIGLFARNVDPTDPYGQAWYFQRVTATDAVIEPGGGYFALFVGTTDAGFYEVWASGDLPASSMGGAGDEISLTVTGSGASTVVIGSLNGTGLVGLTATDISPTLSPSTLADLPLGLHAGIVPAFTVDDASAVSHDGELAVDNFEACPL